MVWSTLELPNGTSHPLRRPMDVHITLGYRPDPVTTLVIDIPRLYAMPTMPHQLRNPAFDFLEAASDKLAMWNAARHAKCARRARTSTAPPPRGRAAASTWPRSSPLNRSADLSCGSRCRRRKPELVRQASLGNVAKGCARLHPHLSGPAAVRPASASPWTAHHRPPPEGFSAMKRD
jgi:hypothetical protein